MFPVSHCFVRAMFVYNKLSLTILIFSHYHTHVLSKNSCNNEILVKVYISKCYIKNSDKIQSEFRQIFSSLRWLLVNCVKYSKNKLSINHVYHSYLQLKNALFLTSNVRMSVVETPHGTVQ